MAMILSIEAVICVSDTGRMKLHYLLIFCTSSMKMRLNRFCIRFWR